MPAGNATDAAARARLRWWVWPLAVTAAFLILQPVIGSGWAMFPDSYRYAKQAEQVLGASTEQAHEHALEAFCSTRAAQLNWSGTWVPRDEPPAKTVARAQGCVDSYAGVADVTTSDPRYQAIFTTRPGYPLLAAPFIASFGIADGMRILGFVIAAASGIAAYAVMRRAGIRPLAAASGQAVFLLSPLGWWALQGLGEGLVTVSILGAVGGTIATFTGRLRPGLALIAASWVVLAFTRYSTLMLVAAALAAACVILAMSASRGATVRRRHTWIVAAAHAATAGATAIAMPILGLPGSSVTLQDTFTRHFADPLVPDPWRRLANANLDFWPTWLATPSESWPLLGCTIAAFAALIVWRRDSGGSLLWISLALFTVGAAHIAAHPLPREAERLGLLMWVPAAFGVAVALHAVIGFIRAADGPSYLGKTTPLGAHVDTQPR